MTEPAATPPAPSTAQGVGGGAADATVTGSERAAGPPGSGGWAAPRYLQRPRRGLWRSAVLAWIVAGILLLAVVGLSVALATSSGPPRIVVPIPGPGRVARPSPVAPVAPGARGGLPSIRSVAAAGIVTSVSFGSFSMTSLSGATLIVDEPSSTTYTSPSGPASASSVVKGVLVAVQGTRSGTTITASRVIVLGRRGSLGGLPAGAPQVP
jgi:hypothetical protein